MKATGVVKNPCLSADSIRLMAEAACLPEIALEVAASLSEDVTFRVRQIIDRAIKFMRHSNRTTLSCSDINKALKWSDCQPVYGYECNPNERLRYYYCADAQVFRYKENEVDLTQQYKDKPSAESSITQEMMQEALPVVRIEDVH